MARPKKGTYEVGFGKPPKHTRFQPGRSGNPGGKRKRSLTVTELIAAEATRLVSVSENGKPVRLRKDQVTVKALFAKAMKGDLQAAKLIFLALAAHAAERPDEQPRLTGAQIALLKELLPNFNPPTDEA